MWGQAFLPAAALPRGAPGKTWKTCPTGYVNKNSLWLATALLLGSHASAQTPKTVLDGVYTAEQAGRGEAVFAAKCSRCHEGADADGPPLTGDPFIERWREDALTSLFQFVKTKMPQDAAGSLDQAAYADVLARILRANQYPAGNAELKPDTLANILLVGSEGPKPLPTNAMVLAVGCLAPGANNTWMLTNAAALARTQTGDVTTPEEMKMSASKPLGSGTFRLQNLTAPESLQGHKVQAKGVLVRQTNNDRINVLSLESLAATCGP
jgi:mono/diheme cytochrome c family protein